ncbi:hypothetical protein HYH03_003701 [Edaphochlamys debaryana]|uniref:SGNH hydrolase-type esterase domain-containing protein n=1 Tax=Edaphochlamys debaryana TaxID=47281 RepID=A0A836C471_9CHLO|nr:hypothetical protein HYH03_003701 [Edaphochlamys debaryana]|eukprot:KAG2498444.1 hypothetical protein HYH03_003701 [Edaphochlamys debaryana]
MEENFARQYYDYAPELRVAEKSEAGSGTPSKYRFIFDRPERVAGITYQGPASRLRLLMERVRAGHSIRVGALGGSITGGQGIGGNKHLYTYGAYFTRWLNAVLPPTKPLKHHHSHANSSAKKASQRRSALEQGEGDVLETTMAEAAELSWFEELLAAHGAGFLHKRRSALARLSRAEVGASLGGEEGPSAGLGVAAAAQPASRRSAMDEAILIANLESPQLHHFTNGGVPGTLSAYMSSCMQTHIPENVDLVFVEYSVNDVAAPSRDFEDRRPFERLLRKALALPSRPAVVLVHFFPWRHGEAEYWESAERDYQEYASFYGLPAVSLRAAMVPAVEASYIAAEELEEEAQAAAKGKKGAEAARAYNAFLNNTAPSAAALLPNAVFGRDLIHPTRGGHVLMAEVLATLCLDLIWSNDALRSGDLPGEGAPGAYSLQEEKKRSRALLATALDHPHHHTAELQRPDGASGLPQPQSLDEEEEGAQLDAVAAKRRGARRALQASSKTKKTTTKKKKPSSSSSKSKSSSSTSTKPTAAEAALLKERQALLKAEAALAAKGPGWGDALISALHRLSFRPLPEPLVAGNYPASHSTCYIDQLLPSIVQQPVKGWNWTDEGRGKWGWVALEKGETIELKLDTRVPGSPASDPDNPNGSLILLGIAFLQSYSGMGRAKVVCESGCKCKDTEIDSLDVERTVSLTNITNIPVSQHQSCLISVTTLGPGREAPSEAAAHPDQWSKFKLMGLVVGEEAGAKTGTVGWLRMTTLNAAHSLGEEGAAGGGEEAEGE